MFIIAETVKCISANVLQLYFSLSQVGITSHSPFMNHSSLNCTCVECSLLLRMRKIGLSVGVSTQIQSSGLVAHGNSTFRNRFFSMK